MAAIRRLEELSLNAWPAIQTLAYDGWLLRFAAGYTRRANSVNPLYPGQFDAPTKLRACETIYAGHGLPTVFKLTSAAEPAGLDALLAAEGYHQEAPTSVQTLDLASLGPTPRLTAAPVALAAVDETWLADFCRLNRIAERHWPVMRQMLASLVPTACFLALRAGNETVAVGLAVLERGHLGLFDIVTAPDQRGQGHGTALVHQLLTWGQSRGAHTAYLQVMRDNLAAQRLYARLGFQEQYGYWYRVQGAG